MSDLQVSAQADLHFCDIQPARVPDAMSEHGYRQPCTRSCVVMCVSAGRLWYKSAANCRIVACFCSWMCVFVCLALNNLWPDGLFCDIFPPPSFFFFFWFNLCCPVAFRGLQQWRWKHNRGFLYQVRLGGGNAAAATSEEWVLEGFSAPTIHNENLGKHPHCHTHTCHLFSWHTLLSRYACDPQAILGSRAETTPLSWWWTASRSFMFLLV